MCVYISVIVLLLSAWVFRVFSKSLLGISNFPLCSPNLYKHYLITFNSLSHRLPIFTEFFFGILLCSLFWNTFLFASFYLTCCFYLCVSGRLAMFPNLGKVVIYWRHHKGSYSALCSGPQSCGGAPYFELEPFCCGRLTTVGTLVGAAGP